MKAMESFLMLYYLLDQCYWQYKEDDLGGFLGAISPELWGDGRPVDRAIFIDWKDLEEPQTIDERNIVKKIYDFLDYYEKRFGLCFIETKKNLLALEEKAVANAALKTKRMYEKFNYPD